MGTTTNNGWTYPESTDLVKDGATAIETLATDIDTTLGVYAPSTPGLTLINTTSFSGVSSQSINDVFSATYQNYLILLNIDTVAASNQLSFRMRVGGADNTSANYKWQKATFGVSGALTGAGSGTGALANLMNVASISGTYTAPVIINIFNPFETDHTSVLAQSTYFDALANHATTYAGGQTSVTTSYTGFTFFSGTFSGTVRVYGYNN
jgi:hypothetical protein